MRIRACRIIAASLLSLGAAAGCVAQTPAVQPPAVSPSLFSGMRWREIGPMRAGRTRALAGVPRPAGYLLLRRGQWWRVEDHGRRPHVAEPVG